MRRGSYILAVLLLAAPAHAVEVEPVYTLQFLGGQYFFSEGQSKVSGNLSGLLAPGIRFNERWELYPSLRSAYKGTKEVVDVVGAGTVFQEQMDHRLGVKGVYNPEGTKWRLKPSASYTAQLLKETADESFGNGLFDYRKMDFGFEGEYVYRKPLAVRASVTYFMTHFPNYTSLESQASTDFQGQSLARELVGDYVLDSHGQLLAFSGEYPFKGMLVEGGYTFMHQRFGDQRIVDAAGALTPSSRHDIMHAVSGGVKYPHEFSAKFKAVGSFGVGFAINDSSQNNYDALRTHFVEDYYDYREISVSPGLELKVGDPDWPTTFCMDLNLAMRSFPGRFIQNEDGAYQGDNLSQTNFMISATASRPIAPRFKVLFNVQHGIARSNQEYEQLYTYNYSATSYLFGLSYDY
ncbi:hypothetical protein ACFL2T_05120 [Elusimicrobiota bacterium]